MSVQLAFLSVKSIIQITVRENDRVKGKDVNSNSNEVILMKNFSYLQIYANHLLIRKIE